MTLMAKMRPVGVTRHMFGRAPLWLIAIGWTGFWRWAGMCSGPLTADCGVRSLTTVERLDSSFRRNGPRLGDDTRHRAA